MLFRVVIFIRKIKMCGWNYYVRMDSRLFDVFCNVSDKCIFVFKVSVEIWLKGREKLLCGGRYGR